jgi:hypothetical protein
LDHILGVAWIVQHGHCQPVTSRDVRFNEAREAVLIPSPRGNKQLLVGLHGG